MKHVIVINTVDGRHVSQGLRDLIVDRIESTLEANGFSNYVESRWEEKSAISAVHEMYGAPKWDPETSGLSS